MICGINVKGMLTCFLRITGLHSASVVDDMGYPVGYFDETYGSLADDPIERNQPLEPDVRDVIE